MIQAFYSGAIGAQQQMKKMEIQGNNIANVNTYGYKNEQPAFGTVMYGMVNGVDGAQLPKGSGAAVLSAVNDYREGTLEETGKSQDYAIVGRGFFGLYDPATGEVSYTRDGSFALGSFQEPDANGVLQQVFYLTDGEGRQVLNVEGYPIRVTDPSAEQPVGVFEIQYQDGLLHAGSGRFLTSEESGQVYLSASEVRRGWLETSNTDLAGELGKVIEAQRAYSYALRMVTTADEVETTINNLAN